MSANALQYIDPVNVPSGIDTKQSDRLGFMEGEGRVSDNFNSMGAKEIENLFLNDGGELSKESVPLHCLGFLAQFENELPNAEEALDEDYLSLVSRNLEEWESDEDEDFGENLSELLLEYFLTRFGLQFHL